MKLIFVMLALTGVLSACQVQEAPENQVETQIEDGDRGNEFDKESQDPADLSLEEAEARIEEDQAYYEVEDVAAYIHQYEMLPPNYITKAEADEMEWSVEDNEGYVIGGDSFGNREGLLPEEAGRQYYEADIAAGYTHHRGPERLVFSDDGLIFYTDDHYASFEQLY